MSSCFIVVCFGLKAGFCVTRLTHCLAGSGCLTSCFRLSESIDHSQVIRYCFPIHTRKGNLHKELHVNVFKVCQQVNTLGLTFRIGTSLLKYKEIL